MKDVITRAFNAAVFQVKEHSGRNFSSCRCGFRSYCNSISLQEYIKGT